MNFTKIIKNKFFWPILTFILIIPAFAFLFKPGYYNMHDDMQMVRQLELEKCFQDGQFPCRWTPDLGYGYGYPLFNFYPPMPYFVGQVYRTFGFTFMNAVKATAVTQIVLAAAFMYLLAVSIFGPLGATLSAIFYTYAPYHALNLYVRGAMNEAWASVFFPLTLYFSRRLILENKFKHVIFLALSFTGILLSHNPMALTFTPILFLWCLFWLFTKYKKPLGAFIKDQLPVIIKLAFSGLVTLAFSAFYTLPVLFESKYVQIESMFKNYYHFSVHFTTLYQLFISSFWGDGASVWGTEDNMSFMVGYLQWIIPLIIVAFSVFFLVKNRKKKDANRQKYLLLFLLIAMGLFNVFMTHNKSTFLWLLIPIIQKIQFPWRFLNHSMFLLSLSAGGLVWILKDKISKKAISLIVILLSLITLFVNLQYFTPLKHGPLSDEQKFSGQAWTNQITSGIYDYLPKTARIAPRGPAKEFIDEIYPKETSYQITDGKKGTDWFFFTLTLDQPAEIFISQLAFPDFEITDNGQKIDYQIESELGRLTVDLSAGEHQISVKFINTPIRTVSNYISLVAWLTLLFIFSKPLWKRLIYNK
jgi:hypothetical protein